MTSKIKEIIENKKFDEEFRGCFDMLDNFDISLKRNIKSYILQHDIELLKAVLEEISEPSYVGVLDSNEKRRGYDMAITEVRSFIEDVIK